MSKRETISQLLDRKPKQILANTEYVNTGIRNNVNTGIQKKKKKATFEFDPEFHRMLKRYAAGKEQTMVEIVETAVKQYMSINP